MYEKSKETNEQQVFYWAVEENDGNEESGRNKMSYSSVCTNCSESYPPIPRTDRMQMFYRHADDT